MKKRVSRRELLIATGVGFGGVGAGNAGATESEPDGRYIVGTSSRAAADETRRRARRTHREFAFGPDKRAVAGEFPEAALRGLRRRPDVRYVEADGEMRAIGQTLPWGVDRVDAERVHADGGTGADARVAVVDTGVDSDHPDLATNLGAGAAFVNASDAYSEPWDDDNGHGTHCAGVAGAVDDDGGVVGVSTRATLHAVKVLADDGSGYWSDVAAGIKWAADRGCHVANLSVGGGHSETVADACRYAEEAGTLVVAAAGNDGGDVANSFPAAYPSVVAVSAVDANDDFASFSNRGEEVDLAAPGVDVYSTLPGGYGRRSGTSMACPHVSGAVAQLVAAGYAPAEARRRLAETAERLPDLSSDQQGAGLLDAEAALADSNSDSDAAPTATLVDPTDGAVVSGTVAVTVDASDDTTADALTVEYRVDDGAWRSTAYSAETGYYEATWDTTAAADGDHSVTVRVTDDGGNVATEGAAVTVDNAAGSDDTAPTVEFAASEAGSPNPHAEVAVDWRTADADGDLTEVRVELTAHADESLVEVTTRSYDGVGSAAGSEEFTVKHGGGGRYDVTVAAADRAGNRVEAGPRTLDS